MKHLLIVSASMVGLALAGCGSDASSAPPVTPPSEEQLANMRPEAAEQARNANASAEAYQRQGDAAAAAMQEARRNQGR